MKRQSDRGAAAVEFALVAMLLVMLLMGIMEFGFAFFVKSTLGGSAREAARHHAIHSAEVGYSINDAEVEAREAASSLNPAAVAGMEIAITPASCQGEAPDTMVKVNISYAHDGLTGMFFNSINLRAEGAMRCNG